MGAGGDVVDGSRIAPIHPSAVTPVTSRPPGAASRPAVARRISAMVSAGRAPPRSLSAIALSVAAISPRSTSTHSPRTRTSPPFAFASADSSSLGELAYRPSRPASHSRRSRRLRPLLDAAARRGYTLPADAEAQAETPPPIPPPSGEEDAEAGIDEDRRALPEERVRRFRVEIDRGGFGGVEQARRAEDGDGSRGRGRQGAPPRDRALRDRRGSRPKGPGRSRRGRRGARGWGRHVLRQGPRATRACGLRGRRGVVGGGPWASSDARPGSRSLNSVR